MPWSAPPRLGGTLTYTTSADQTRDSRTTAGVAQATTGTQTGRPRRVIPTRGEVLGYRVGAVIGAAKISDFFPVEGVALPQLTTTCPGERVEMPNVSPGHTDVSPNSGETCTGSVSQPRVIEKVRR